MRKIVAKEGLVLTVIALIISAIGVIVSMIAISSSTLDARYNISALDDGIELDRTFKSSDSHQYQTITVEPCKGVLKVGYRQKTGTSGMQYRLYYKKTTASSYTLLKVFNFGSNNIWYGPVTVTNTNGYTDYNMKLLKYSGTSRTSRVQCDFMID